MALILAKELPSGVTGSYWRISYVTVNCQQDIPTVEVNMALYITEDHRKNKKEQISFEMLNFNLLDIDSTFSYDFRACLYQAIKQRPEWANSLDALDEEPIVEEPVEEPVIEPVVEELPIDPIVEEPVVVEPAPVTFGKKKIR
jgi:hypothetical protein